MIDMSIVVLSFIVLHVVLCFILVFVDDFLLGNKNLLNHDTFSDRVLFALWGIPLVIFLWTVDKFIGIWYIYKYGR